MAIQVFATKFPEAKIIIPEVFEDDRGFFKETYSLEKYGAVGIADTFVQDSVSFSARNVLRGLHFDPKMSKLVQALRGKIFDVIVDMRQGSPTLYQWQGFYLSEHNHKQLYIPAGFANGFLTLTEDAVFSYKHGALHDPSREGAIRWNDPKVNITWPIFSEPRLSIRDKNTPLLQG